MLSVRSYLFYGKDISRKVVHEPPTMTNSPDGSKINERSVRAACVGSLGPPCNEPEQIWLEAKDPAFTCFLAMTSRRTSSVSFGAGNR